MERSGRGRSLEAFQGGGEKGSGGEGDVHPCIRLPYPSLGFGTGLLPNRIASRRTKRSRLIAVETQRGSLPDAPSPNGTPLRGAPKGQWAPRSSAGLCAQAAGRGPTRARTEVRYVREDSANREPMYCNVKVRIKAPLNTSTGTRKACLKPARNSLGKYPRRAVQHLLRRRPSAGGGAGRRVWELPERVSSRFEIRFSGPGACIERCFYPHLYITSIQRIATARKIKNTK